MVFTVQAREFKFDDGLLRRLRNALEELDPKGSAYGKMNVNVNLALVKHVQELEEGVRRKQALDRGPINITSGDEDTQEG